MSLPTDAPDAQPEAVRRLATAVRLVGPPDDPASRLERVERPGDAAALSRAAQRGPAGAPTLADAPPPEPSSNDQPDARAAALAQAAGAASAAAEALSARRTLDLLG